MKAVILIWSKQNLSLGLVVIALGVPFLAVMGICLIVIFAALVEVGPGAFACLSRGTLYVYEPGRVLSHWGILRDLPETAVNEHFRTATSPSGAHATEIVVERVAVNMHMDTGLTDVQTRIRWSDGVQTRYLVELFARSHNNVAVDTTPYTEFMMCSTDFSKWEVWKVSPIAPTPG